MDGYQTRPKFFFGDPPSKLILTLIGINVVCYILQMIPPIGAFALRYLACDTGAVFGRFHIWQLVTSTFLHGGPIHLAGNMLFLYFFGNSLVHAWRSRTFLLFYFLCGIFAAICFCLFAWVRGQQVVGLGASGAVFGVMIAYGIVFGERWIFFFMIPMKAKIAVAICFGISIMMLMAGVQDGTAHIAHVGGAVFGAVYLKVIWRIQDRRSHPGATGRKARKSSRIAGLEAFEE